MVQEDRGELLRLRLIANWTNLLTQQPAHDDIQFVVKWIVPLRLEAAQWLLDNHPSHKDLEVVIKWVTGSPREEAKRKLLNDNPTHTERLFLKSQSVAPRKTTRPLLPLNNKEILAEMRRLCG